MDQYEPKIIITPEQYDSHLLNLHREVGYLCENRDPPNPFRGLLEEGDNLRIAINDTNDLRFCVKHFEERIADGEFEHVIIGDPNAFGYGFELLDKILEDVEIPAEWNKNKQWIFILLNTDKNKLVIEHGKIRVED